MNDPSHVIKALHSVAVSSDGSAGTAQIQHWITSGARGINALADHASFTSRDAQTDLLETAAATARLAHTLDELQYELRQGPCFDAVTGENLVIAPDIGADERWPLFGPRAAATGVRSMLAICLIGGPRVVALNIYSTTRDAFAKSLDNVWLVASFARVLLGYAPADALTEELLTGSPLGSATAIVVERFGLSTTAAFEALLRVADREEVRLHLVADHVLTAGL